MEIFFTITGLIVGFMWGIMIGFIIDFKVRKKLYARIAELESEGTE